MNLLINVKERCAKSRVYGLGLLVLCAAVGVVCSVNLNRPDQVSSDALHAEAGLTQGDCASLNHCGHAHADHQLSQAKQVIVNHSARVVDSKPGDQLELSFGEELKLRGTVTVTKDAAEGRRAITMSLVGQQGSVYWLEDTQGGVIGNVILTENGENQVYKFTGRGGQWLLQEIPFQHYICASGVTDESVGMPMSDAPFTAAGVSAIVPLLNSRASAEACVYLDFDGEVVSGTRWLNGATINAEESGHSEAEIRQMWDIVSEDMRPFDLNVTTDRAVFDAAPVNRRMHVIITPTKDAEPSAGGVAYLQSFYDGSVDPCWVFVLDVNDGAIAVSHEVGHTFGLRHDGLGAQEYHPGNGTWGPIMGAPYGHSVVNWSEGNYTNNTNTEDDLAMISSTQTNGFGYREEDYGDSNAEAHQLGGAGAGDVSVTGVISTTDDVDVFSFQTNGGVTTLSALNTSAATNMNIQASLYDDSGNVIGTSEAPGYTASITETLDPGVYYFHVEGIADGSPDASGFNDYGSLGQYGITGNIEGLGGLIIDIVDPVPEAVSILAGNGLVLRATVAGTGHTSVWTQVGGPAGGVAKFDPADALTTRATFTQPGLYTLRFTAASDGLVSQTEMQVSVEAPGDARMFANRGPAITISSPEEYYSHEGALNGRAVDDGIPAATIPATEWLVLSGTATIANPTVSIPEITFKDSLPNVIALESSDGEIRTFKEMTVKAVFESRKVVASGTPARWSIPLSNDLGMAWVAPAFDDSTWAMAKTGLGFNSNDDYLIWIGEGGNLKAAMKGKSPSAFIRIPFSLPTMNYVSGLMLKMKYNDGFVAYINGVEVARRNVPAGPLAWNSTAGTLRSFADVVIPDEIDLNGAAARDSLVAGENVLAIHGLNKSKKGAQFLIDPVFEAGIIASPYLAFIEQYGLDLLPGGDKDGDGLLNFVEHALRTDPTVHNVETPLVPQANGSMKITLPLDMPQDIDYIIEQSLDVVTWTQVASKHGMAPWDGFALSVSVDSITNERITYNLRTLKAVPQAFFRLRFNLRGPEAPPAP